MSSERGGIAFSVDLERPSTPKARLPERLQRQQQAKTKAITPNELKEKQRKADERRKVSHDICLRKQFSHMLSVQ